MDVIFINVMIIEEISLHKCTSVCVYMNVRIFVHVFMCVGPYVYLFFWCCKGNFYRVFCA
jgi:hypothetical protein